MVQLSTASLVFAVALNAASTLAAPAPIRADLSARDSDDAFDAREVFELEARTKTKTKTSSGGQKKATTGGQKKTTAGQKKATAGQKKAAGGQKKATGGQKKTNASRKKTNAGQKKTNGAGKKQRQSNQQRKNNNNSNRRNRNNNNSGPRTSKTERVNNALDTTNNVLNTVQTVKDTFGSGGGGGGVGEGAAAERREFGVFSSRELLDLEARTKLKAKAGKSNTAAAKQAARKAFSSAKKHAKNIDSEKVGNALNTANSVFATVQMAKAAFGRGGSGGYSERGLELEKMDMLD